MIVLDTTVVLQLTKRAPRQSVIEWLDSCEDHQLLITAVTLAEMRTGVATMAAGRNKEAMSKNVDQTLGEFGGVCLPFDGIAAEEYALIIAARKAAGRPISMHGAQIAAIARSGGFTLATLDTKDFEGIEGLKVVNPAG